MLSRSLHFTRCALLVPALLVGCQEAERPDGHVPEASDDATTAGLMEPSSSTQTEAPAAPASELMVAPDIDLTGWTAAPSEHAGRELFWRTSDGGDIPRNENFDLDLLILQDGAAHSVETLRVSGWMPAHSHGFLQVPEIVDLGEGRYRIEGVRLHMRGHWQILLQLYEGQEHETVRIEVQL